MKKRSSFIIIVITCLFTLFSGYQYHIRSNLNYTENGTYFSIENGVIYKEQTKELYAIFAIIGFIVAIVFMYRLIRKLKL